MVTLMIIITLFFCNFRVTIASPEEQNILDENMISLIDNYKSNNLKLDLSVARLIGNDNLFENFEDRQIESFDFVDDKARLEVILTDENELDALEEFNENIVIENYYKSLTQVLIPIDLIQSLSQEDFVLYIRKPITAYPLDIVSEGVARIGADLVHAEGVFGAGTKVAIIDLGFEGYGSNPELPSDRIAEAISFRADGDIGSGEVHGCACAEIILDVAPQADLYLYNFDTISELNDAVSHAISVGVDIISFSIGFVNINNYDGIGHPGIGDVCGIVDNARSNGILFATAAGNEADHHYEGTYTDNNVNDWHEFGPGDEELDLGYLSVDTFYYIDLAWDDWPYSDQDYDLYLFDDSFNLIDYSVNIQTGSQPPNEWMIGLIPYSDYYYVDILRYDATRDVYFELYGCDEIPFPEYNHPESSLTCPADAFGSMTCGATYWQNDVLEPFSSRGPTNDGRTKPDVTAPDGVSTYASNPFYGTSASAPHTAGAAALLKSADPSLTANDLQNKLESTALDLGPGGKDNSYGSGRINVWAAYNTIDQPPNADFTYAPLNPTTLDVIQFTDTSTDDGTIVSWDWAFDDGNTSTAQHPTHQYGDDGIYTVSLTVTDDEGKTDDCEDNITVGNTPPNCHY